MRGYATRQISIGLAIAGIGLIISLSSYQAASENGGGGYMVLWGAVLFGLIRAFRGARLYFMTSPSRPSTARFSQPASLAMPPPPAASAVDLAKDDLAARITLGPIRSERPLPLPDPVTTRSGS